VLLKVLKELVGSFLLDLEVFGFKIFLNVDELDVGILASGSREQITLIVHLKYYFV